ncbi:hypothetical protein GCM10028783_05060 [Modestobacter muralis]
MATVTTGPPWPWSAPPPAPAGTAGSTTTATPAATTTAVLLKRFIELPLDLPRVFVPAVTPDTILVRTVRPQRRSRGRARAVARGSGQVTSGPSPAPRVDP